MRWPAARDTEKAEAPNREDFWTMTIGHPDRNVRADLRARVEMKRVMASSDRAASRHDQRADRRRTAAEAEEAMTMNRHDQAGVVAVEGLVMIVSSTAPHQYKEYAATPQQRRPTDGTFPSFFHFNIYMQHCVTIICHSIHYNFSSTVENSLGTQRRRYMFVFGVCCWCDGATVEVRSLRHALI